MKQNSGPKMDPKKVDDFKKKHPERHRIYSLPAQKIDPVAESGPKGKPERLPYSGDAPYLGERWK